MSRVLLVTASAEFEQRVRSVVGSRLVSLPHLPVPADPARLFEQLTQEAPAAVIVIDCGLGSEQALTLAAGLDQQCPGISVVLVSELGPELGMAAMRAGVRDILSPNATAAQITHVLDRASSAAQARISRMQTVNGAGSDNPVTVGRIISVVSPKGGVGKTTVATNLAVALAESEQHSTVLVDLDVQFGDVGSALNLDPEYSLTHAVHGPASQDTMVLKTFLATHSSGLYVLCGPDSPAAADNVTGKDVSRLLKLLASEFRYVVVDTAPGLGDHALAALDAATDLVLLTSMDVPGVRGLRKELDTLTDIGILGGGVPKAARHVVLNFVTPRTGLSVADVQATIGTSIDVMLPRSKAVTQSVNEGIPLLQSGLRDPMAKELRRLVHRIAPAAPAAGKSRRRERRPVTQEAAAGPIPRRAALPWYHVRRVGAS